MKRWTDILIVFVITISICASVYAWKGICKELDRISSFSGAEMVMQIADITAYSPSPNITSGDPFTMASGRRARPTELEQLRFVAVSRDLMEEYGLEYGDTIWIGFRVEDTMNKRIEDTVDVFMRSLDLARRFGRQKRQIIIFKKGGKGGKGNA